MAAILSRGVGGGGGWGVGVGGGGGGWGWGVGWGVGVGGVLLSLGSSPRIDEPLAVFDASYLKNNASHCLSVVHLLEVAILNQNNKTGGVWRR